MSDPASTWELNAAQLGAALAQLRARLEFAASTPPSPTPREPPALAERPQALARLGELFGLSRFEEQVFLLSAAMELDTRIAALCARAQDDPRKPYPTFALALSLLDEPAWDVVSPYRPLRYWRLIEVGTSGGQPLTASPLRADERIVNYLKGLNNLDERLANFLGPLDPESIPAALAPSQERVVETILARCEADAESGAWPLVLLAGTDSASKQLVAQDCAARLERSLCRLPAESLPVPAAEVESLARLWRRETVMLPLVTYVDAHELDPQSAERVQPLIRFLGGVEGPCFLGVRDEAFRPGRHHAIFRISKPEPSEQRSAWLEALGAEAADLVPRLSAQFSLNLPTIRRLHRRARAETGPTGEALSERVWSACCGHDRPRLDSLAQRLEPKAGWDDLVLPADETALLRRIAAQVAHRCRVYGEWGFDRKMSRGFGISALFAGDSGTGKTMSAEVLARELGLNLYRIDLSSVVNKYIGETEKNLRRLFDAAEDGGTILFFDEADALFGKRSEVKDSHDRYANIEVNYLLQRMESYRGLAILATNRRSALDTAFVRRLRFIVNFPFPDVAHRRLLWRKAFPLADAARGLAGVPLADLDYDRLARFNLAGGHIHNIALNAAFLAADAGTEVTSSLVLEAVRSELLKLGHPISNADFAPHSRNGQSRWTSALQEASP